MLDLLLISSVQIGNMKFVRWWDLKKTSYVGNFSSEKKEVAIGWYFDWTGSDRVEWSRRTREVTDVAWRRLSK